MRANKGRDAVLFTFYAFFVTLGALTILIPFRGQ